MLPLLLQRPPAPRWRPPSSGPPKPEYKPLAAASAPLPESNTHRREAAGRNHCCCYCCCCSCCCCCCCCWGGCCCSCGFPTGENAASLRPLTEGSWMLHDPQKRHKRSRSPKTRSPPPLKSATDPIKSDPDPNTRSTNSSNKDHDGPSEQAAASSSNNSDRTGLGSNCLQILLLCGCLSLNRGLPHHLHLPVALGGPLNQGGPLGAPLS